MSKDSNAGAVLAAFVAGSAIGVALGVLFAPNSGEKTRKDLSDKAESLVEEAQRAARKAARAAEEAVESGKKIVGKEKKAVKDAIKAGKKVMDKAHA
jgi:gas vesicle protein